MYEKLISVLKNVTFYKQTKKNSFKLIQTTYTKSYFTFHHFYKNCDKI